MREPAELKDLQERARRAVELARRAGAGGAWATCHRTRASQVQVRAGVVEKAQENISRGLNLSLYVDGRYSSHSTTDLRADRLEAFVREAVAMTRALQPDEHRALPDPALFGGRPTGDLGLADPTAIEIARDRQIAWCQTMNRRASAGDRVISATSSAGASHTMGAAASSNGFAGAWHETGVGLYTQVNLQDEGDKRPSSGFGLSARGPGELGPPDAIGAEALARARARLGSRKGPTARTRMVVDRHSAMALIWRLLGPATARAVQQKSSFWAEHLGQKSVSDTLTIVDDPLLPGGLGSRYFDSEGIAARTMPVITAGVLENLYVDTYYGRKLGAKPTTGDPSNRVVKPGARPLEALLADADGGILVTGWLGGNLDGTTGDFSLGAQGHRIEGGGIGAPIGEMNVTGNIRELFSRLVEVGSDVWPHASIRTPSLVFDDVSFSGA